ncbi:heterodisulfide reductase-related iron-sulfur binding cluster [Sporomusa malonica]|uniref:Cysteine-rich domain-containing protein n=1 Tax=Sporomusa malonica TaxID=112901 RepID=A0A1W1Y9P7_9FIRM|nr:heterodisulfide reductase-related iron-sulfur binding cluster [Sporomusa malonica]SMC32561.1 Cysteine-rich domain-containing protein [Sporomusa malonica]
MNHVYAPGCALILYKPELAKKMLIFLNQSTNISEHLICCRHNPKLPPGTKIINTCAGCDRRYRELYEGISTISLWEIVAESNTFPFPDYQGMTMSVHDACPTRTEERVHKAIRKLLTKMNIKVVEPQNTQTQATCCGDSFYGTLPLAQVKEQMKKRADEMPVEDVVVYCVSCIKAMHIGGKKPHYIVDLLWGEDTTSGTYEPDAWHQELQRFIDVHS